VSRALLSGDDVQQFNKEAPFVELILSKNRLSDHSACSLADAISMPTSTLAELSLSFNERVTSRGAKALALVVRCGSGGGRTTSAMRSFSLNNCSIGNDGASAFRAALADGNAPLVSVFMIGNRIDDSSICADIDAMAERNMLNERSRSSTLQQRAWFALLAGAPDQRHLLPSIVVDHLRQ
jgi:Leucine Rich repeat